MANDAGPMKMSRKVLLLFALLLYIAAILYAKFFQYGPDHINPSYNWIPFAEYHAYTVKYLLFNALVFIPYGVLIAYVKRNTIWFFAVGLLGCFIIELLQPLAHTGVFDITTVIADLIGMVAGYFAYTLIASLMKKDKTKKEAA